MLFAGTKFLKGVKKLEAIKKLKETPVGRFFSTYPSIFANVALFALFAALTPVFLTTNNIMNVLRQVSMYGIMAVGMCFVAFSAHSDIAVGSTVGIVNVVWAKLMIDHGWNPTVSAIFCMAMAIFIGWFLGLIIAKLRVNAMIATFAMQSLLRALVFIITQAYPIYNMPESIKWLGHGYIFEVVPIPVAIMIVVAIIGWFVHTYTKFGRSVYSTGGNREAAYLSGIKTDRMIIAAYMICHACAALASFVVTSRLNAGLTTAGTGWEFEATIACIVGGISLGGGRGRGPGCILGAIFIGALLNGMTLINIDAYTQQAAKGIVLLVAICWDTYSYNHKKNA